MSTFFLLLILFSLLGGIILLLYLSAHIFIKLWNFLRWHFLKSFQRTGKKRTILYHILGLGLFTVCIILTISFLIPYRQYRNACRSMKNLQYRDAVLAFHDLENFLDSKDLLRVSKEELLKNASVGDTIFFGSYEQDYNAKNGMEELEWIVLERQSHNLLLLSKSILDIKPYKQDMEESAPFSAIWETSFIRNFLQNEFFTLAFTLEEQSRIQETDLATPIHTFSSDTSETIMKTRDTIFLLSQEECEHYFSNLFHGIAYTTSSVSASLSAIDCAQTNFLPFSYRRCIQDSLEPIPHSWYLRDSAFSSTQNNICTIFTKEGYFSHDSSETVNGVRPALWLDFTK